MVAILITSVIKIIVTLVATLLNNQMLLAAAITVSACNLLKHYNISHLMIILSEV